MQSNALRAAGFSVVALVACHRAAPSPSPPREAAIVSAPPAPPAPTPPQGDASGGGSGRGVGRNAPAVYVDGREVAALRYAELPASLPMVESPAHAQARYFRVADYLAALHVPVARVRAVHLVGHDGRVASIEGTELRREPARFVFDFTMTTAGHATVAWSTVGLHNAKRIDAIHAVGVFVSDAPPALNLARGCYADGEGCAEEAPFASSHGGGGVRVYSDARLAGRIRRREVQEGERSLAAALGGFGVLRGAGTIDLVSGDERVARVTLASGATSLDAAHISTDADGRVVVSLAPAAGGPCVAPLTAIVVHHEESPRAHPAGDAEGGACEGEPTRLADNE